MKYILLFMTILMAKSLISSFLSMFKSSKSETEELTNELKVLIAKLKDILKGNEDAAKGFAICISVVVAAYFIIYYIMTSIYMGNLLLVILSCYLIIKSIKANSEFVKIVIGDSKVSLRTNKLGITLRTVYVGYFIYFVITTWS